MSDKTMKGIDISHYQSNIDLSKVECDFVICKATEGVSFIDKTFEKFMQKAEYLGKCTGFYHFARPENNDAVKEAQFFYKHTKDYIGRGIPVLDWESSGKSNVAWALKWLNEVYNLTGVKPMIYMSQSVTKEYNWKSVADAGYTLWVAKYKDYKTDKNYDMTNAGSKPVVGYWPTITMWQWTDAGRLDGYSGNLDCNIFYGDKAAWNKIASKSGSDAEKPAEEPKKVNSADTYYIKHAQDSINSFLSLHIKVDGIIGQETRKAYSKLLQTALNKDYNAKLKVDGIIGEKTIAALGHHYVKYGETQYLVSAMEIALMLLIYYKGSTEWAGYFGAGMKNAVIKYQRDHDLKPDGICGYNTIRSILHELKVL